MSSMSLIVTVDCNKKMMIIEHTEYISSPTMAAKTNTYIDNK